MTTIGAAHLQLLAAAQFIAHFDRLDLKGFSYSSDYDLSLEGRLFTLSVAVGFCPDRMQVERFSCELYPADSSTPLWVLGSQSQESGRAIEVINDYLQHYAVYIDEYTNAA